MAITRNIMKGGVEYRLNFDDEGVLDTVYKYRASSLIQMNGGQKEVQFFVNHMHDLYARNKVKNCEYI